MLGGHVGVERHGDDVVGGVAGGGQGAAPLAGLVDRHHVAHPLGDVLSLNGLQPHLTEGEQRGSRSNDRVWIAPFKICDCNNRGGVHDDGCSRVKRGKSQIM